MSERRYIERIRGRLERETGTVYKPHGGRLRVAIVFPNTYYVGMSNLGIHLIYRLLNDREDAVCERVFLPDPPDLEELLRTGAPLLTMESQTPVRDFDVLAFSVSFELDYPNIVRILSLSGLNALSEERLDSPLVIAGGPAATFNPEPLASFVDAFVIGEAEAVLPDLVDALMEGRDLPVLARIPGVYVPRFYDPEYAGDGTIAGVRVGEGASERITRQWTPNLEPWAAGSAILTPETEFSNMVLAEVARGCGRQCRFCVAGYAFLPPRSRSPHNVLAGLEGAKNLRVGLLSASVFDHPSSLLICRALADREAHFSISSTRADTLNRDIAQVLHRGGHETLTIAPEAGTDRLRQVINKRMTDEEILNAARVAWDGGFRRLKLYFMVGLPTETEEDVAAIPALAREIAGLFPWERVSVSVSCFVPKPWTPFQWVGMDDEKSLAGKVSSVQRALRPVKRVEVGGESPREAVVQGVLARGDRRVHRALLHAADGKSWRAAFRESGVDPAFYAQRHRERDEILPWDHVDLGVTKRYLWMEYERALRSASTPPCMVGVCRRCGVCHVY